MPASAEKSGPERGQDQHGDGRPAEDGKTAQPKLKAPKAGEPAAGFPIASTGPGYAMLRVPEATVLVLLQPLRVGPFRLPVTPHQVHG